MRIHEILQLNELVGVNRKTRLDTISRKSDARRELQAHGFKKIGNESSYGYVFAHPGLNYVLKVFEKDKGYEAFYKCVSQHQDNPHFPKFRGKMMQVVPNIYAIRMEKLKEIPGNYDFPLYAFCKFARYYLRDEYNRDSYDLMQPYLKENYPLLFDALIILKNAHLENINDIMIDMHDKNIMLRGNTLVIIDPFANWN